LTKTLLYESQPGKTHEVHIRGAIWLLVKKMSRGDILKKLVNTSLSILLLACIERNRSVKEFLDFYVNPDERDVFNNIEKKYLKHLIPHGVIYINSKTENKLLVTSKNLDLLLIWFLNLCCFTLRKV